ncbi:hypothetical protein B0H11DRAFT_2230383 [Mycena galericulata]|nr:hypothetical protein B0H11DRAFT_2230383 [Mycena galericulata]
MIRKMYVQYCELRQASLRAARPRDRPLAGKAGFDHILTIPISRLFASARAGKHPLASLSPSSRVSLSACAFFSASDIGDYAWRFHLAFRTRFASPANVACAGLKTLHHVHYLGLKSASRLSRVFVSPPFLPSSLCDCVYLSAATLACSAVEPPSPPLSSRSCRPPPPSFCPASGDASCASFPPSPPSPLTLRRSSTLTPLPPQVATALSAAKPALSTSDPSTSSSTRAISLRALIFRKDGTAELADHVKILKYEDDLPVVRLPDALGPASSEDHLYRLDRASVLAPIDPL